MSGLTPTGLAPTGLTADIQAAPALGPTLTNPTGMNSGELSGTGTVTTDTGNGTLYYLTTTNPTALTADIKLGSSQPVTVSGVQNITITGLSAGTTYYNHYLHTDASENDSNVASSPAWSTTTSYSLICDAASDSHSAGDVQLTYSGLTAYSIVCDLVADTHTAADVALTYIAFGLATITSEPLRDNTNTLLANQALDYVAIYDNTTGALVLRVTGISTNASGIFTVSDAALTGGVTYKLDWKVTIQSAARMPAKAAV